MADYIYLLENRLSPAQRTAVRTVAELARARGLTVFLVGAAVRDLTSGSPVRDLEIVVQGGLAELRPELERSGVQITGQVPGGHSFFARFPGGARAEIGSTVSVTYPKPGKPVVQADTILEDLRRRGFTADAMALSLNPGSYGLLMDPLNGVADIENRQLRLVSNYGFIEAPERMIHAARLMARLGWTLDERTETRYQTGKDEGYISALSDFARGYETEEIVHEEDALRVLGRLEAEGWMAHLAPFWTTGKANTAELERLHEIGRQLEMNGIHADLSAASFPLLTAKLSAKEVAELKQSFPRQGFVAEIEALDGEAKELGAQLTGKTHALPSQTWKLLHGARPEAVVWLAFTSKSPAIQAKFKSFASEWPQARQRIPFALLQEMRIVPELPGYDELVEKLGFELMDGRLGTPEEMRAYLEPHSPPAPPPPVSARKLRAAKKEAKPGKGKLKKTAAAEPDDDGELETVVEETLEALAESPASGAEAIEVKASNTVAPEPPPAPSEPTASEPKLQTEARTKRAPAKTPAPKSAQAPTAAPASKAKQAAPAPATKAAPPAKAAAPAAKTVPAKTPAVARKAPVKVAPAKKTPAKVAPLKPTPKAPAKMAKAAPAPPAKKTAKPPVKSAGSASAPPAKKTPSKQAPAKKTTAAPPAKKSAAKAPAKAAVKAPARPATKAAKAVPAKVARKAVKAPAKKVVAKTAAKRRG